jgi:hypothetical protein
MAMQEMTPEEAVLYQRVYLPAYIEKSASNGYSFADQGDLMAALEISAMAKMAIASRQGSQIKQANLSLKRVLGFEGVERAQQHEEAVKTAAASISRDPEARAAILKSLHA